MGKESEKTKRVRASRKNRIENRVGAKPDLEKGGEESIGLPAAMAAAPWNREEAEHERNFRGGGEKRRSLWITMCSGRKMEQKEVWGFVAFRFIWKRSET